MLRQRSVLEPALHFAPIWEAQVGLSVIFLRRHSLEVCNFAQRMLNLRKCRASQGELHTSHTRPFSLHFS